MNKQQLASKIWAAANELRGKVSASDYKDYMLGLIFYKYVSEKEEKYLKEKMYFEHDDFTSLTEKDVDTVENCQRNIGYFIEYKNLYSYWINKGKDFEIKDVRTALSAFNRLIGHSYKKVYDGIFETLEKGLDTLGTMDSERTKAIRKLIDLINKIPMDGSQNYDVLGFVYEFLLKNFAANAGKAGEFYTPYETSMVMSEIIAHHLKERNEISIYDPTSGSGSLLINIGKALSKYMSSANKVKYYAQELIPNTYNLTRMNLVMRDIIPANIIVRNGDTLGEDWPFFDDTDKERTYDPVFVDGCCSNPPYSQSWDNADADNDIRFKDYGVSPKSKADLAFLLHNLYHLKPDGIMTIVMPHGVLFRGGDEGKIREKLIENNNIETIIGLPANIFFGTGIPTTIIVLKKNRQSSDVLFVDASKGFVKDGNKNKLLARDIRKIVDTVIERKDIVEKYSRLVSKKEIVENGYNLNIPRYIDSGEDPELWDIYSTMFGGIPNAEIDELKKYWETFPTLRKEIFKEKDIPYSDVRDIDVNETIKNNTDVKNFVSKFNNAFRDFSQYLKNEVINNRRAVAIQKEERVIASKIKENLQGIDLIDYFDAYQILDNNWTQIYLDLELIQAEGDAAIKKVDPNMVAKKNSKTKEIDEVQQGWVGHVLPFELVQNICYKEEKDKLDCLTNELASLESTKNALLDSIDPNDKAELLKDDSDEIESKKLSKVISNIKKQLKIGVEFEEDSYEDIIIKVNESAEKIRKIKKELKDLKISLENLTKTKIENLSDAESLVLLEEKWIKPFDKELKDLTTEVIEDFISKIEYLKEKYETTYKEVSDNIITSKKSLCSMIDELTGNEFDMKGLEEFKKLIGGKQG